MYTFYLSMKIASILSAVTCAIGAIVFIIVGVLKKWYSKYYTINGSTNNVITYVYSVDIVRNVGLT